MSRILVDDHRELDELLDAAFSAIDGGDRAAALANVDLFWARLAMHIRAEHLHLFPAISDSAGTGEVSAEAAREKLEILKDDHNFFMRELIAAIKELRLENCDLAAVRRTIEPVAELLIEHNAIEETEVYGWAGEWLGEAEYAALQTSMRRELANLPPRFR